MSEKYFTVTVLLEDQDGNIHGELTYNFQSLDEATDLFDGIADLGG